MPSNLGSLPGKLSKKLEQFLESLVLVLMGALALVVILGVGFRKGGAALVWYDETAGILLTWLTYYGASLAALRGAHIGFPGFVQQLAPPARRICLILRETVILGFLFLLAYSGIQVMEALRGTYLVSLPWLSTALVHSAIPLGALLFAAAEVLHLANRDSGSSVLNDQGKLR